MYDWADVAGLACDAKAGPGEQNLSNHSWGFCLRVAQTHYFCLQGQRKCFTGATAKFFGEKYVNESANKNFQQPNPEMYLKNSLEDEV